LLYLESDGNKKEMQASIQQMIEEIRPYESKVETGHEVIDVILGEKLQLCQEKEITCVPYIDGRMFDFVKPLDLCTIFGNAMDNAIESCVQIPETDKRQINIHSLSRGDSVVLTFRNTYHKKPDFSNGLPVTTKSDEKNHGYGLRNMRYIADKYHGTVNCTVEQDEFVLTILLQKNEHPVTL
jgi:sensor histidine kinase regulating citrate/malate metabolism